MNKFLLRPADRRAPTIFDLMWGAMVLLPTQIGIVNTPEVQSLRAEGVTEGFAVEMYHLGTEVKQFELVFHRPGEGENDFYIIVLGDGEIVPSEQGVPKANGVWSEGTLFQGMRYGSADLMDLVKHHLGL